MDLSDETRPVNPGLIAGSERAEDALQFARRADADLYRRAHLGAHIAWVIEPLPQTRPPSWSDSCPVLDALQDMEAEDAAKSSDPLTEGFPYS